MGWLADRAEAAQRIRRRCGRRRAASSRSACPTRRRTIRSRRSQWPDRGSISVYARNRDYHDVVKGMLKHLAQFIVSRFGPRREGVRRYRAGDGEAAGATRRARLAGQAHQPGVARARLLAVPGRDLHHARHRARRTARGPLRHLHALPRRSARPTPFPRPTGSMRRAASPTSRSSTTARSRTSCAR